MSDTVLILRDPARAEPTAYVPVRFSRPRVLFAKSVMEVKAHLLRGLSRMEAGLFALPGCVMLDMGARDLDIKSELTRWISEHPRLRNVQILLAAELSLAARLWSGMGRLLRLW